MYHIMYLKCKIAIIASLILLSNVLAEERLELVIDEKLTLEEVFAAGFRPSSVNPSDQGSIRVWERQKVTLIFDDFRYNIDTEQTTFLLYDDNQISSLRIMTTSEMPLSVDEAVTEVKRFSDGLDMDVDEHINIWREKCKTRGSMAMAGFGGAIGLRE